MVERANRRLIFTLLAGAAVWVPQAAAAEAEQQPAPQSAEKDSPQVDESGNLDNAANQSSNDIVVTATRQTTSLQDVPMSVDVASGEQIQRLNIFDAKDVQQLSPGLELTNTGGRNNVATLRGIQSDPDAGAGAVVDFYFNEVPVDIQTAFTAIYDIDQIEVLRGPQGALRGRTSPAGAITLRTRRPNLDAVDGYFQATGTEDHAYNLQGAVSVPVVAGQLGLRMAALYDKSRGNQVRNLVRGDRSNAETQSFRISLGWSPNPDINVNLAYQYLNSKNVQQTQYVSTGTAPDLPFGTTGGVPRPIIDVNDYASIDEGRRQFLNRTNLLTLNSDFDLGPVIVQATGGLQRTTLRSINEIDAGNIVPNYTNEQRLKVPYPIEMAEVRLLSDNPGGFLNWSLGGYYYHQGGDVTVSQGNLTFLRGAVFQAAPGVLIPIGVPPGTELQINTGVDLFIPVKSRTYAVSGSVRLQLTEKLRLEAAGRYTDSRGEQRRELTLTPVPAGLTNPIVTSTKNHDKPFTGGANLTYEVNPDLTVYAAYGRSFRGGTTAVAGPTRVSTDLLRTPSEKSDAYEIGVKSAFFDRRVSLNVAAFYQSYNNFITRLGGIFYDEGTTTSAPDGTVNGSDSFNYAADVTVKGVEATLAGRPTDNWDFSVSGAYTKARFDNAALPCNDFNGDGVPDTVAQVNTLTPKITGGGNVSYCVFDSRPTVTPDFNFTANSEYRFAVGAVEPFIRGIVTYRPGVSTSSGYRFRARTLMNLFAGVRGNDGAWEVNAFVKNVLNQHRITSDSENEIIQPTQRIIVTATSPFAGLTGGGTPYRSGYRLISSTVPREWGITTTLRF